MEKSREINTAVTFKEGLNDESNFNFVTLKNKLFKPCEIKTNLSLKALKSCKYVSFSG